MYQQRNPSTVHSTRGGTLLSGRNHEEGKYGSFLMVNIKIFVLILSKVPGIIPLYKNCEGRTV